VEEHQREEPHRLGSGQELDQEPAQPDRLAREIVPRRASRRRTRSTLVEDEVDHVEHGVEPVRQLARAGTW
jgi:hypothetical protein